MELTLIIVTPAGAAQPVQCDSVHLTVCDDLQGRGGGSYGIRAGHTKTLLALEKGSLAAFVSGETVLAGKSGSGFATVDKDVVTAVVEFFTPESAE